MLMNRDEYKAIKTQKECLEDYKYYEQKKAEFIQLLEKPQKDFNFGLGFGICVVGVIIGIISMANTKNPEPSIVIIALFAMCTVLFMVWHLGQKKVKEYQNKIVEWEKNIPQWESNLINYKNEQNKICLNLQVLAEGGGVSKDFWTVETLETIIKYFDQGLVETKKEALQYYIREKRDIEHNKAVQRELGRQTDVAIESNKKLEDIKNYEKQRASDTSSAASSLRDLNNRI